MTFSDHFSSQAKRYADFRPGYPPELLSWLAAKCPAQQRCWDAGTGSGQVAILAADHFDSVYASDASASQIAHAIGHPRVTYAVEPAEEPDLPDDSVDLITVGAAIHWLDRPSFFDSAKRVGRPGSVLAAFSYGVQMKDSPALNAVLHHYVKHVLDPWWTEGHELVLNRYVDLTLPFERINLPLFHARSHGNFASLKELLRTWSGAARMSLATQTDPVELVEADLKAAWKVGGETGEARTLEWPIFGSVGRI
ncbi:MAG: class I SAM-dependent methyltransferase [Myxococcota bacterium]